MQPGSSQGASEVIVINPKDNVLEAGLDRRTADGGAAGR